MTVRPPIHIFFPLRDLEIDTSFHCVKVVFPILNRNRKTKGIDGARMRPNASLFVSSCLKEIKTAITKHKIRKDNGNVATLRRIRCLLSSYRA